MRSFVIACCAVAVAGPALALDADHINACKLPTPQVNRQLSGNYASYNQTMALAMSCIAATAQHNALGPDTATEAANAAASGCQQFITDSNAAKLAAFPPVPGGPPAPSIDDRGWAEDYALRVVVESRVCFAYGPRPVTFTDPSKQP